MDLPRAIEVLTINVWGLPWPLSRDRARRWEHLARHFRGRDYHLVGVQEAWWPLGQRLAIPGLRLGGGRRDSGLGLGGSLPTVGHELSPFTRAAGFDRLKRKGLLLARAGSLTVTVTHLQAGDEPAIRAHQVAELVERLASERGPVVLMGDFNFAPHGDRDAEALLARAGLADTAASGAPTFVPRNPFTAGGAMRFDRIYVRDGGGIRWTVAATSVLPRVWSDHQPVHATLGLTATG